MSKFVKVVGAAAAGFVAGILLAPKSGKETRADIKAKADEVKTKATEAVGVAKEKATAGYEAAKVGATEVGKEVTGFFGRASKQAGTVAKDAKKTASTVADDAKEAGRNVRDAVK
jgi:gas vesicle protein